MYHMIHVADHIQAKARHQLTERLIAPINEWFGTPENNLTPQQIPEAELSPGVHQQTPESVERRKREWEALTPEQRGRTDPNYLDPRAARLATIAFCGAVLILILLIWFVTTCRNASPSVKYRPQN